MILFRARFTSFRGHSKGRDMPIYEIAVEIHCTARVELGELGSQFPVSNFAKPPSPVESLESVSVKTPPRFIQEFQISRHRNYVLVVVPLLAYLEILENLARYIGLQG